MEEIIIDDQFIRPNQFLQAKVEWKAGENMIGQLNRVHHDTYFCRSMKMMMWIEVAPYVPRLLLELVPLNRGRAEEQHVLQSSYFITFSLFDPAQLLLFPVSPTSGSLLVLFLEKLFTSFPILPLPKWSFLCSPSFAENENIKLSRLVLCFSFFSPFVCFFGNKFASQKRSLISLPYYECLFAAREVLSICEIHIKEANTKGGNENEGEEWDQMRWKGEKKVERQSERENICGWRLKKVLLLKY